MGKGGTLMYGNTEYIGKGGTLMYGNTEYIGLGNRTDVCVCFYYFIHKKDQESHRN